MDELVACKLTEQEQLIAIAKCELLLQLIEEETKKLGAKTVDDILATTLSLGSVFGALGGTAYLLTATGVAVGGAIALPVGLIGGIALFVAGRIAR